MIQTLLEERFKLVFHREINDAQVYALVPAKKGTNPRPKLSRSINAECPTISNSPGLRIPSSLARMGISCRLPVSPSIQRARRSSPRSRSSLDRSSNRRRVRLRSSSAITHSGHPRTKLRYCTSTSARRSCQSGRSTGVVVRSMELNISFASKAASAGERNVSFAIGGWPDFAVAARKVT